MLLIKIISLLIKLMDRFDIGLLLNSFYGIPALEKYNFKISFLPVMG